MILTGDDGNNILMGLGENDALIGKGGNDQLYGGDGGDNLEGNDGDDQLYGEAGNDNLLGGWGSDILSGGDGNDMLSGGTGTRERDPESIDILSGGNGDDLMYGGDGHDLLQGDAGLDVMYGGFGNDQLEGGTGDDELSGGPGSDRLYGGDGNDTYIIENINDIVSEVGTGIDTVQIEGSQFSLYTLSDNLENLDLFNTFGNIDGTGNSLDNRLNGNNSTNILSGLSGNDTLIGGQGDDVLDGGLGIDILRGDNGNNTLTGGHGSDRFLFTNPETDGTDQITDFSTADDSIILFLPSPGFDSAFRDAGLTSGAVIAADQFHIGTSATNANQRFIYDNASGKLFFDADGSGTIAQTHMATLSTGLAMTNSDIFVYEFAEQLNDVPGSAIPNNAINGDAGNNTLMGTTALDVINGFAGDDIISGGASPATDILTGGSGKDYFYFSNPSVDGSDRITDFSTTDDKIAIFVGNQSGYTNVGLTPNAAITADQFHRGGAAVDASDRFIYENFSGKLYFDADGNGAIAKVEIASLPTFLDLSNANIVVFDNYGASLTSGAGNTGNTGNPGNPGSTGKPENPGSTENPGNPGGGATGQGTSGNDTLVGGSDRDTLVGFDGNDVLIGGSGNDILKGGNGNDRLFGNKGNDQLWGGTDSDIVKGGKGKDIFVLEAGAGRDTIRDFSDRHDRLGLTAGLQFKKLTITQIGKNTLISLGDDQLAILTGVRAIQVTGADFVQVMGG